MSLLQSSKKWKLFYECPIHGQPDGISPAAVTAVTHTHEAQIPARKPKKHKSGGGQVMLTSFFTKVTKVSSTDKDGTKRTIETHHAPVKKIIIDLTGGRTWKCPRCENEFKLNPGGNATHLKSCSGPPKPKPKRVSTSTADDDSSDDDDAAQRPPVKARRLTKDGAVDRRGSNKGAANRLRYMNSFKFEIVILVHKLKPDYGDQAVKEAALRYKISISNVRKWLHQEDELRARMTSVKYTDGKYAGATRDHDSIDARRVSLATMGRGVLYPRADAMVYAYYRTHRYDPKEGGKRVGGRSLRREMRFQVLEIYGISDFKATKKWLCGFAKRRNISLRKRNNKKSKTALERLPKVKRWFARLKRRLRHGPFGRRAVEMHQAPASDQELFGKAHRGNDGRIMVSHQGNEGGPQDCMVCAVNNLISGRITGYLECVEVAERITHAARINEEEPIKHYEEGVGNFSSRVLCEVLAQHELGYYRLSKDVAGECGHARALVEMLVRLFNVRVCGAIWRIGESGFNEDCSANASGHWIAASHIPSTKEWDEHQWHLKDGMRQRPIKTSTEFILRLLDNAEKKGNEFYVVVDLKDM